MVFTQQYKFNFSLTFIFNSFIIFDVNKLKPYIMTIEVTEKTFYKLFENEPVETIDKETYTVSYYLDNDLEQRGQKVFNNISSKVHQYYLTDINA